MEQGRGEPVGAAEAWAACERILASPTFAKARMMGRLLRYLVQQAVEGNLRGTTEYAIGLEVLRREAASYSPGDDPAVRVQVGRLRQRLEAYHAQWLPPGELGIRIPLGSYMPVIERKGASSPVPPMTALAVHPLQFIAGSAAGEAFARGLQEELLSQMVQAFGPVVVGGGQGMPSPRVVVSTLRIDEARIRASVRLLEAPQQRVTWAQQFDHAPCFGIQDQEVLAASICGALKRHLVS